MSCQRHCVLFTCECVCLRGCCSGERSCPCTDRISVIREGSMWLLSATRSLAAPPVLSLLISNSAAAASLRRDPSLSLTSPRLHAARPFCFLTSCCLALTSHRLAFVLRCVTFALRRVTHQWNASEDQHLKHNSWLLTHTFAHTHREKLPKQTSAYCRIRARCNFLSSCPVDWVHLDPIYTCHLYLD